MSKNHASQRFLFAMAVVNALPVWLWLIAAHVAAFPLSWWPTTGLRRWRQNADLFTPTRPSRRCVRKALVSWTYNMVISAKLGSWSPRQIERRVHIAAEDRARLQELHERRGLVVALSHSGSWDLAGAWGVMNGLPVTSVAQRLPDDAFHYYSRLRSRLGMQILPHTDRHALTKLAASLRSGRVVALLCDRGMSRRPVEVQWRGSRGAFTAGLAAGPALLASQHGAGLVVVSCWFERQVMHVRVSADLNPPSARLDSTEAGISPPSRHARPHNGGHDDKGTATDINESSTERHVHLLSQAIATEISRAIASHPHDWHMMQPFRRG